MSVKWDCRYICNISHFVHTIVEHNFLLRKNISNLRHYDTAVSQDLLHALSRMQADREIYRGTHTHIYMYIYM